ncbi:TPA: tRNA (adenosine(37)-N6)-dimethylallyltransferase MiaA [Candidatus Uhrbacteria bacterium]|nr:tRNA (adenosine(37)-N6)-dimethylallyltransferase MiaA [Candidatus Uhrbacteria bacterium]
MNKIKVIAVVGPTASGKTDVGVRLAQALDGEVLCVDSRTVYKGMDIGTAKVVGEKYSKVAKKDVSLVLTDLFAPRAVMVEEVPHWGIDLVQPDEAFTVADFVAYAQKKIVDISRRGKLPILVGGTGLYFRALLDGLTLTDVEADPALRIELEAKSTEDLLELLGEHDPEAVSTIDEKNRRRIVRALEIVLTTGATLKSQQEAVATPYEVLYLGMEVEREVLFERINSRVDVMVGSGLIDEARGLLEKYGADSQAMSGIGYRQLARFFAGTLPLREAIERIKIDSRHYAKRQLTWFKADQRVVWVKNVVEALTEAKKWLEKA